MISETFLFRLLTNVSSIQAKSWKQNLKHDVDLMIYIFFRWGAKSRSFYLYWGLYLSGRHISAKLQLHPLPPTSTSEIQNWGGDLVVFTCSLWYDIFCTWIFFLIYLSWQILLCLNAKAKAIFRNFKFRISAGSRKLL